MIGGMLCVVDVDVNSGAMVHGELLVDILIRSRYFCGFLWIRRYCQKQKIDKARDTTLYNPL